MKPIVVGASENSAEVLEPSPVRRISHTDLAFLYHYESQGDLLKDRVWLDWQLNPDPQRIDSDEFTLNWPRDGSGRMVRKKTVSASAVQPSDVQGSAGSCDLFEYAKEYRCVTRRLTNESIALCKMQLQWMEATGDYSRLQPLLKDLLCMYKAKWVFFWRSVAIRFGWQTVPNLRPIPVRPTGR